MNYQIVIRTREGNVTALLICPTCNSIVAEWSAFVGTLHLSVDTVNADIAEHRCEA